jgi:septal ring factor EnvC (AmiA/AmiB activator)
MEPETTTTESAVDNFDSLLELEARIQGIADRFGDARREQQAAEQTTARLESIVSEQDQKIARLQAEVEELRNERNQVRARIEALLGRIESL